MPSSSEQRLMASRAAKLSGQALRSDGAEGAGESVDDLERAGCKGDIL
jgi:hypothetical protein